jgi:hypothetical protein
VSTYVISDKPAKPSATDDASRWAIGSGRGWTAPADVPKKTPGRLRYQRPIAGAEPSEGLGVGNHILVVQRPCQMRAG